MSRPNFLRPAPMPRVDHYRPSWTKRAAMVLLNFIAMLIVLAKVGIAFVLMTLPALPILVKIP